MEIIAKHEVGSASPCTSRSRSYGLRRRRLVIEHVDKGREFQRLQVYLETLLLQHAGEKLGIFLGFRIEADGHVIGQFGQTFALGETSLGEQLLRLGGSNSG